MPAIKTQNTIDSETIPVVEESVQVSKRTVETGTVRVRTVIDDAVAEVNTSRVSQTSKITRRTVDVPVDTEYEPRQEGDEWVIPVFEYKPVVTMQLYLKEELRVSTSSEELQERQRVPVKRQRVVVERRADRLDGADGRGEDDGWVDITANFPAA